MKVKEPKGLIKKGSLVKSDSSGGRVMVADRFRVLKPGMEQIIKQAFCIPLEFSDALDGRWYPISDLTVVGQLDESSDYAKKFHCAA